MLIDNDLFTRRTWAVKAVPDMRGKLWLAGFALRPFRKLHSVRIRDPVGKNATLKSR